MDRKQEGNAEESKWKWDTEPCCSASPHNIYQLGSIRACLWRKQVMVQGK
jgi:hypothetical protein